MKSSPFKVLAVVLSALLLALTTTVGAAAGPAHLVGPAGFGCDLVLDAGDSASIGSASISINSAGQAVVKVAVRKSAPDVANEIRVIFQTGSDSCGYGPSEFFTTNARGAARYTMQPQAVLGSRARVAVWAPASENVPYSALFEGLPMAG